MKTLIFNGSPRKSGDTVCLISEMQKYIDGETKIISAYYDNISPCIDCRYCWENTGCCLDDDMREVYEYIKECDNIIIASPIYFSELTGATLNIFSRLQCFWASRYFQGKIIEQKDKSGVLILTGGGSGGYERAKQTADSLFKLMKAKRVAEVHSLTTDKLPASEDSEALNNAKSTAMLLNSLYRDKI